MTRRVPEPPVSSSGVAPAYGDGLALQEGWRLVIAAWGRDDLMAEQTGARLEEIGGRFVTRLTNSGRTHWVQVTQVDCQSFVQATTRSCGSPSVATQHLRRSTVRAVFRTLRARGLVVGDPTLDLVLPPREPRAYRPLTDDEVLLCRASSRLGQSGAASLRRAVAWALGEATAATSEIGAVRLADLDSATRPRWLTLHNSRRYTARFARLTDWGSQVVARQAVALMDSGADGSALLAYGGAGPAGAYLAQASVCTQVTKVLNLAGLGEDPAVRARSLRGWAGARMYSAGVPIEQVAVRMGCHGLDATAAEIGLEWKPADPLS
ncbi:hypothetical protein [Pedococcus soli]